jgi:hypothetical protein
VALGERLVDGQGEQAGTRRLELGEPAAIE